MESSTNVTDFAFLEAFIRERLTSIGGEIFQVVTSVVVEFQGEISRSKQENFHLKKTLEQIINNARDAVTQQDVIPLEEHNSTQGSADWETSEVHVKLEYDPLHQDPDTPQQLYAMSQSTSLHHPTAQDPPPDISGATVDYEENGDVGLCVDSDVAVKSEDCKVQEIFPDRQSVAQNESSSNCVVVIEDEPSPHSSSQCTQSSSSLSGSPSELQNSMTGVLHHCEVCAKSFKNGSHLKMHMLSHQREISNRCMFCGKFYRYKYALQNHLKTHAVEKPYKCKMCTKTFCRKSRVKIHEKIHTGEKPFSCSRCGKTFLCMNQVQLHIQTYHSEESVTVIEKSTKYGVLQIAQQAESKNDCAECGQSFCNKRLLQNHLKTHTTYKCKFCDKTFKKKWHMQEHERIHTGEKKYSCGECGMRFTCLRDAKFHARNHHNLCGKVVQKIDDANNKEG